MSEFRKLPRSFYLHPTLAVAKDLLGKYFIRKSGRSYLIGRIVEVEAYLGDRDPASHAYRGKTKRNEVMFKAGGHLYVYFTYGMHYCANVVTEAEGIGRAILLRAIEPVSGIALMKTRRHTGAADNLTNGPAKLCEAFGISREENGTDLLGKDIFIAEGRTGLKFQIVRSRRIGIRKAIDKKWRFSIKGNPHVSKPPKTDVSVETLRRSKRFT